MCSWMGSIILVSTLLIRFCGSILAPNTQNTGMVFLSFSLWQMAHFWPQLHSGRAACFCQVLYPVPCCGSHLLLSFRGTSLSNQWRLPFPVFKHGYADNCILILLPVILIHLELKSSASAQLSILIMNHQYL